MKQFPSNLKFKKYHRPIKSFFKLNVKNHFIPKFGLYGLKSLESGLLTFNQIEAGRRSIKRSTQKDGFVWINLFTYMPITSKPLASRMGKGKGSISYWVCPIRSGQILYEIGGLSFNICLKALKNAGSKLPIKTKIIRLIY